MDGIYHNASWKFQHISLHYDNMSMPSGCTISFNSRGPKQFRILTRSFLSFCHRPYHVYSRWSEYLQFTNRQVNRMSQQRNGIPECPSEKIPVISLTCFAQFQKVMFAVRFGLCYGECQPKPPMAQSNCPFSMCQGKGKICPMMFGTNRTTVKKKNMSQKYSISTFGTLNLQQVSWQSALGKNCL